MGIYRKGGIAGMINKAGLSTKPIIPSSSMGEEPGLRGLERRASLPSKAPCGCFLFRQG